MSVCSENPGQTARQTSTPQTAYQAYLIRLWPTQRSGIPNCRASLEQVMTRERREFGSLESLFDYLRSQVEVQITGLRPVSGSEAP
jgi:hypothetical protein